MEMDSEGQDPPTRALGSLEQLLTEELERCSQRIKREHIAELLVRKVASEGLKVSEYQKSRFCRWVENGGKGPFSLRWKGAGKEGRKIVISFSSRDVRRLVASYHAKVVKATERATEAAIMGAIPRLRDKFKKSWPAYEREFARGENAFRARLLKRYRQGFELFSLLLTLARELGDEVNDELRAANRRGAKFEFVDVITRLHARSCQIGQEIGTLLRAGYADGAIARWRSLHEVTTVLQFIAARGPYLAQRYAKHDLYESLKGARVHMEKAERLKESPPTTEEFEAISNEFKAAVARYGKDFDSEYGWAAAALKNKRPKFSDIEEAVGLDHIRPYYKLASHNVHANPKGIFHRLCVLGDRDVLPTGATNLGLTDSAQHTAISIVQATSAIVMQTPQATDRVCVVGVMNNLVTEIAEAFQKAEREIQIDEERLREGR